MIQLHRDRTAVPASFLDPDRKGRILELFRAARDQQLTVKEVKERLFSSSRWKDAKQQLGVESAGKCAFCETPTSAAYYGDVEHFRPKAIYWWLAYCYDNYLYSCRVCNGKKSDQHLLSGAPAAGPLVTGGMDDAALLVLAGQTSPLPIDAPGIAALSAQLLSENPWLPHPYDENGEAIFIWQADDLLHEVRIAARPGSPRSADALRAVEQILDLNRGELLTARWQVYNSLKRLRGFSAHADTAVRDAAIEGLREAADGQYPYSGMVRYFAHELWGLI
jgi:hypothetical protein